MSKVSKEQARNYFEAWREVYKDKRLRGFDLPVLLLIRDTNFSDFYFSQGQFAKSTGFSRKAINESLQSLVECGYLSRTDNFKQGSHKPHHFKLKSELVSPSKDNFSHVTDGLHVMLPKGYMKKKDSEPVMSPNGYTNGSNEKDLISPERESFSSSIPQEIPVETPLFNQALPTSDYSSNKDVQSVLALVKEHRPDLEWSQRELAGLSRKLEEVGLNTVFEMIEKRMRLKMEAPISKMFTSKDYWNSVVSSEFKRRSGTVEG